MSDFETSQSVDNDKNVEARVSRRRFTATVAAGTAYAAFDPFGATCVAARASQGGAQQDLYEMSAVELATQQ